MLASTTPMQPSPLSQTTSSGEWSKDSLHVDASTRAAVPFIADHNGSRVIPEAVDDNTRLTCPDCNAEMGVHGPFTDGTARHFFHQSDTHSAGCTNPRDGPGESATHRKLKSLAVSALRTRFEGAYQQCSPEIAVDVSHTDTDVDERRADALLEFTQENRFYGNGIVVEVQHLNTGKDRRGTTHDFLQNGYSVYWATPAQFTDDRFDIDEMEAAFNDGAAAAFSAYRDAPPELDAPNPLPVSEASTGRYTTTDPVPACSHEIVRGEHAYRECVVCGLTFEKCWYDAETEMVRRRPDGVRYFPEDTFLAADTQSIEHPVVIPEVEEYGDPPDHDHEWKQNMDVWDGGSYPCSSCDSRLWVQGDRIVIQHREDTSEDWKPEFER